MIVDIQDSLKRTWDHLVPSVTKFFIFIFLTLFIIDLPLFTESFDLSKATDVMLNEKLIKLLDVYGITTLMPFIALSAFLFLSYTVSQLGLIIGRLIPIHFIQNSTFELLRNASPRILSRLSVFFPKNDNHFETLNLIDDLADEKIMLAENDDKSYPQFKEVVYSKRLCDLNVDRFIFIKFLIFWIILAVIVSFFSELSISLARSFWVLLILIIFLVITIINSVSYSNRYTKNKIYALDSELRRQFIKPSQPTEDIPKLSMMNFVENIEKHIPKDECALSVTIFGKNIPLTKIKKKK